MSFRKSSLVVIAVAVSHFAASQGNGKLQIHFMDVGQGDGAVLISPGGQVVLFDAGEELKKKDFGRPVSSIDQLQQALVKQKVFDRGQDYPNATYQSYEAAVGSNRVRATPGQVVKLDSGVREINMPSSPTDTEKM